MAFENLKSTGITYLLGKLKTVFLQIKDAVKSVNGELPDETGDITINSVPYAQNLESDTSHRNTGTFIQRTSGGDSSVVNGDAWLMNIKGNNDHTGFVAEEINWNLTVIGDDGHITATFNRDTFVNYVANSGTITLAYSTSWSADPTLYGFTITGTPEAGDTITVVYVKEERGTITVANPQAFVSTGWNLFNLQNGYAKVVQYAFDYRIEGPYSTIKFATTPSGTQSNISVSGGNFAVPSDGYVIVTGGTSETAIYATWEDWTDGYSGAFEAYNASTIDLTSVMSEYFPNGLLKAGTTVDEIDLNLGQAISRVERLSYTAANLATAQNSGREYEYDENYIYLARASAISSAISVDGSYIVNDHGIEYFTTTTLEVHAEVLYGNNLKNKLERDVLTISQQTLTSSEQNQVRTNIGAASQNDFSAFKTMLNYNRGAYQVASESALSTVMDTVRATMASGETAHFYVGVTTAFGPFTARSYYVELRQITDAATTSYCIAIFTANSSLESIRALRNTNGWSYYKDAVVQNYVCQKYIPDSSSVTSRTYSIPASGRYLIAGLAGNTANCFVCIAYANSSGVVSVLSINKGANVSFVTSVNYKLTVTLTNASTCPLIIFAHSQAAIDGFTMD